MGPSCSPGFFLIHYTAPKPFSLSDITSRGSKPLNHVCLFPVPCLPHVTSRGPSFQMSPTTISHSIPAACSLGRGGLIISCLDDHHSLLAGLLASSLTLLPIYPRCAARLIFLKHHSPPVSPQLNDAVSPIACWSPAGTVCFCWAVPPGSPVHTLSLWNACALPHPFTVWSNPTTCQGPRWSPFLLALGTARAQKQSMVGSGGGRGEVVARDEPQSHSPPYRPAGRLSMPGQSRLSNVAMAPATSLLILTPHPASRLLGVIPGQVTGGESSFTTSTFLLKPFHESLSPQNKYLPKIPDLQGLALEALRQCCELGTSCSTSLRFRGVVTEA